MSRVIRVFSPKGSPFFMLIKKKKKKFGKCAVLLSFWKKKRKKNSIPIRVINVLSYFYLKLIAINVIYS